MRAIVEIVYRIDDFGAILHFRPQGVHLFDRLQSDIKLAREF